MNRNSQPAAKAKRHLGLSLVLFLCFYSVQAQINVNTNATLTQMINSIVGPGNTVSNVTLNCPQGAYGTFTNGNSTNVGIGSGVLLTSGSATAVNGPGGSFASVDNGVAGDGLLTGLAGATTYDACRLEFDITPACSTLQMQYVFGSEEYPEFVNLGFNDAFGFFISGPNPSGPAYVNYNIALVPSTSTPVTIDNVNSFSNSQYYIDNQFGATIAYDGFTTPLTASVQVVPCSTYHMILVIADGGDGIYDSGVFLTYQGLQCPSPQLTASSDVTICQGQSTTLTANFPAPSPSYTWSPATGLSTTTGSSVTATPTVTTTYIVTGTSGPCLTSTDTVVVTVTPQPTVTVAPSNGNICPGGNVTLTANGANSYTWTPAATLNTSTGATVTASPNVTTVYTVTGDNGGGCSATATATVTVGNSMTITAGPDATICNGQSASITVTGPPPGSTYLWNPTTGLSPTSGPNVTASPSVTTTYIVTATDPSGCSGSDTITVNVTPGPNLATAGFPPTCVGNCDGQVVVIPNGGTQPYTYSWSNGCTTPSCNNLCPGTYNITVTDALGCQSTGSATVSPATALSFTVNSTPSTCGQPDGTACVQVSGGNPGYTYVWNTVPAQNASCATGLLPGVYCVTVTDLNGCSDSVCVTVANTPGFTATITNVVNPSCSNTCDGSATGTAVGGNPPFVYAWSDGQITQTASNLCPGTYTVTITDVDGCFDTAIVTIVAPPIVTVAVSPNSTICIGENASLTATGAGGIGAPYTYDWDNGAFSGSPYVVSPNVTTVYSVVASDANGCPSAPATVTVTVNPPLTVTAAGSTTVCPGGQATITANAGGGDGIYTYTWLPNGSGSSVTVTVNQTTTFTVIVTDGCTTPSDTDTVTVFVSPLPVVSFSASPLSGCAPVCVDFTDLSTPGSGTITSWSWSFPGSDTPTSSGQNPSNVCYNIPGSYGATLTVINSSGCTQTQTINNMINVYGYPDAQFTFGPQPATLLNPQICFTDTSTDAASWQWEFGDPSDPTPGNLQNPCYNYPDTGTYCVELTVTNSYGCQDSIIQCLVISPEFTFWIPNAFTPNSDGINDEFSGAGMFFTDYEMYIFDRWGNLIFYTDDINKRWDGRANHGKDVAQQDVYVYVVKLKDIFEKEHKYRGHVSLIK
jgi:gliding motility-associated-like protein